MAFPKRTCVVCGEEFELKPGKPGFANRCPDCSSEESGASNTRQKMDGDERRTANEANAHRREAMRNLLYRKDG